MQHLQCVGKPLGKRGSSARGELTQLLFRQFHAARHRQKCLRTLPPKGNQPDTVTLLVCFSQKGKDGPLHRPHALTCPHRPACIDEEQNVRRRSLRTHPDAHILGTDHNRLPPFSCVLMRSCRTQCSGECKIDASTAPRQLRTQATPVRRMNLNDVTPAALPALRSHRHGEK